MEHVFILVLGLEKNRGGLYGYPRESEIRDAGAKIDPKRTDLLVLDWDV